MKKIKLEHKKLIGFLLLFITISCKEIKKDVESETNREVTFNQDIAPIIHQNCTPCHRKGEAGPFVLETYKDVAKRSRMIKKVTEDRYMPPWPADHTYSNFCDERVLEQSEIELIAQWVKQGKKEGDKKLMPPIPVFSAYSEFGKPDMVLRMQKPIMIKGDGAENFYIVKIPFTMKKDTFVKFIEFVPNQKNLLHHMNGSIIQYEKQASSRMYKEPFILNSEIENDKFLYQKLGVLYDDGSYPLLTPSVSNYLPGVFASKYPDGIGGFKLRKNGVMILRDLHLGPSAKNVTENSYFNFYFDNKPPVRRTVEIQMGTYGVSEIIPKLSIPANTVKSFTSELGVPVDISILTINPHMHRIGKTFKAFATTPEGMIIPLIKINDWDFRWQYFYTFRKMLKIPKGSIIRVEASFDNTLNNEDNPFDPPQLIEEKEGSMRSTDEMLQFIITYMPYKTGDENISLENKK